MSVGSIGSCEARYGCTRSFRRVIPNLICFIRRRANGLDLVSRECAKWYRKPAFRISRGQPLILSDCDITLRLVWRRGFSVLVQALLSSNKRCRLIRSPASVHPSSCVYPTIEISCQSILPTQSHQLFAPFPSPVYPPKTYCDQDSKDRKEEKVVVEDVLTTDGGWVLVARCGGDTEGGG